MSELLNDADETLVAPDELVALKARADLMSISYHPNIGVEKLRDKINTALVDAPNPDVKVSPNSTTAAVEVAEEETTMQRRIRKRREATELLRIRIQCMNPAKQEWPGEIITVGNSLVGTMSKFIPFADAEDGWHVPRMIYNVLLERQCQVFTTINDSRGNKTRKGKLIKEFAVELMDQMTTEELKDLAQRQALAKSID